jgi:hypothetical protein
VKKIAQSVAQPDFCQYLIFIVEKITQKKNFFSNFQKPAQRKESPNRRKIAQSSHPDLKGFQKQILMANLRLKLIALIRY